METSVTNINIAFQKLGHDSTLHSGLEKELSLLAKHSSEDILFKTDKKSLRVIDNNIRKLITENQLHLQRNDSNGLDELTKILSCTLNQLNHAISKSEIKPLLIFLSINCYLKIDLGHYFKKVVAKSSNGLENKIDRMLSHVHFETQLENQGSFYETGLLEVFSQGCKEKNIEKTYRLISAVERGGRGFHFNFLLEDLVYLYYRLDSDSFSAHLNAQEKPDQIVFYLQSFPIDGLVFLCNQNSLDNKWVLFELIRQIIKKEKVASEKINSESVNAILNALVQILNVDRLFYFQCVRYFKRSKEFNIALGIHCCALDEADLVELFQDSIHMDKYSSGLEARTLLLREFEQTKNQKALKNVLSVVHKKWRKLWNEIATDADGYQPDILLTDLADFIVRHFSSQPKKQLLNQIQNCLYHLIWIDSEWFENHSEQITKFNLYLSELYLLSYAVNYKNVRTKSLEKLYKRLLDSQNIERFYSSHHLNPKEIIHKNITNLIER